MILLIIIPTKKRGGDEKQKKPPRVDRPLTKSEVKKLVAPRNLRLGAESVSIIRKRRVCQPVSNETMDAATRDGETMRHALPHRSFILIIS